MQELYDCSWPADALLQEPDGAFLQIYELKRLTQFAEPYAPVYNTKFLPEQPYHAISNGKLKPNSKVVINYASDEGEEFIESVFYPNGFDDQQIEDRQSRVPKILWDHTMENVFDKGGNDTTKSDTVKEMYKKDCPIRGTPKTECGEAAADWLTDFTWTCNQRSAFDSFVSVTRDDESAAQVYIIEHFTPFPEEHHVESWHRQCYDKSCHCIGNWWLMGSYEREENITDPAELDYGRQFRKAHFEFYETGALPEALEPYTGDHEWFLSTKTDSLVKKSIQKDKCDQFDTMELYMEI